jgi:hypothetical protein
MKSTLILRAAALPLILLLSSCWKEKRIPPPPPAIMHIDLATVTPNQEVIFTDSNGKVLLDTMSPYPNPLVADLKTSQTLLNISIIGYYDVISQYVVSTDVGVNPSTWKLLAPQSYAVPYPALTPAQSSIVYKNVPASLSTTHLIASDFAGVGEAIPFGPTNGYLNLSYTEYNPGNYLYLLFPSSGLYNFHIPKGTNDTVDLSHLDTVISFNFTKPAEYTVNFVELNGILDTADFTQSVSLYNQEQIPGLPDVEYPGKLVQTKELYVSASKANGGSADYYGYGDTVAKTLPFTDESAYNISASLNTNFSVGFTAVHPTDWSTEWSNTAVRFTTTASPTDTHLNAEALLATLQNTKMLKGQNLTGLILNYFYFETSAGMDMAEFYNYTHDPARLKTQRLPSLVGFTKAINPL